MKFSELIGTGLRNEAQLFFYSIILAVDWWSCC